MRRASSALVVLGGILVAASCRDPTEIELDARTNVPWRSNIVTSFTVGSPGETESAFATTETSEAVRARRLTAQRRHIV